jgi:hypothetical protein
MDLLGRGRIIFLLNLFTSICLSIPVIAVESHEYRKPEDVVAWLYRDFAWEAVMFYGPFEEQDSLLEQPSEILERYFSEELTLLILKDRKCVEESGLICRLDFDPIWASQDPGADDLKISPGDDFGAVSVQFIYPSNREKIRLVFKTEKTEKGWRISDIVYERKERTFSLLGILSRQN